ncbi:DUF748 domain-containing protein [Geobacter sp. DSM 9736]|uniref:DUF748 domain-containing protein n=1 Tax=Geobacter sp. DSM 9736 TaxID=1277350 RepID=UPI000B5F5C6D|nr:DUF748 domain-containing protein [Geobacter sp. DSM 9736]SNB45255.1 protein of unknown function [Geobacter sp. DSM 9736]
MAISILALIFASHLLNEPIRSYMEKEMNRSLKGYSVRLPELRVNLMSLSVTLKGLTVCQEADPDHPIAQFPFLRASVHWRALLSRRLVGEFRLDRPKVSINLKQLRTESADAVPIKERGWQQAVLAIYPLKVDLLSISNGEVIYLDEDTMRPLHLSSLNLKATNILNISAPEKVYPSSFHLDTFVFGTGRGTLDGVANFFAEPHPGLKARFKLDKVPIDLIKPIIARSNLAITGGVLQTSGEIEYAPTFKSAHLEDMTIRGMRIDYIHTSRTAAAEKKRAAAVRETAGRLSNNAEIRLQVDKIRLAGCTIGVKNRAASHPYHLYVSDANLLLSNLSNQLSREPARSSLRGRFMGTGTTTATASFRPGKRGIELDLQVKIEGAQLTGMNNMLRTYGDFDVSAGLFSFYSELHIRNQRISGYIKPFFRDMQVYDRRMDKGKNVGSQLYEMMVAGVATLLENRSRNEVATKADISGHLNDPKTSVWQIVGQLFKNAFIRALMPGFIS